MSKFKIALIALAGFAIGETFTINRANKIIAKNTIKYENALADVKFDSFRDGVHFGSKTERENNDFAAAQNRPECGE